MKKIVLFSVLLSLIAAVSFAETDYPTKRQVDLLQVHMDAAEADIDDLEAGTIPGDLDVNGNVTVGTNVTADGSVTAGGTNANSVLGSTGWATVKKGLLVANPSGDNVIEARTNGLPEQGVLIVDGTIYASTTNEAVTVTLDGSTGNGDFKGALSVTGAVTIAAGALANASVVLADLSSGVQASLGLADSAYQAQSSPTFSAVTADETVTLDSTNAVWRDFTVSDDYEWHVAPYAFGAVTNTQALIPVSRYATMSSAADVTCTLAVAEAPIGMVMTLVNIGANVITLADTGTFKTPAAAVIPADGAVNLYSADGTNWWNVGKSID